MLKTFRKTGYYLPISILSALVSAVWLPLRMELVSTIRYDVIFDGLIFLVVVAPHILWPRRKNAKRTMWDERRMPRRYAIPMDIVTALPLVSLADFLGMPGSAAFLVPKLLILRRLRGIRNVLDDQQSLHPVLFRLVPLAFIVPIVVHFVACGWIWLGSGTASEGATAAETYVRAVYWAIATLATVGYGDIAAKTIPQMLYASGTMILGVGFFGYVLSNVASMLARLDAAREGHLNVLDKVETFMRYNRMPASTRLKVRAYYHYLWQSRRGYDDSEVLEHLPRKLRGEVAMHLNAEMIEKVPLLRGAEADLLEDVVLQLKPLVAVPGERIFHVGEPGDAMYFIHHGTIDILSKEGHILTTLEPGAFFGEMALLTRNPRNATACAREYCDLYVLSRAAFEKVLSRYPDFAKHVHEIVSERNGGKTAA